MELKDSWINKAVRATFGKNRTPGIAHEKQLYRTGFWEGFYFNEGLRGGLTAKEIFEGFNENRNLGMKDIIEDLMYRKSGKEIRPR